MKVHYYIIGIIFINLAFLAYGESFGCKACHYFVDKIHNILGSQLSIFNNLIYEK